MKIGELAGRSGLPPKTIRYYEDIGLVRPATRQENGYRAYGDRDVRVLRFLKRARGLGFGVADCRELLSLYEDRDRASADVKAVARRQVADIDRKIAELQGMRDSLTDLIDRCHGDDRPDCPILDDLAGLESGSGRA
ncbi:MAG: Cu(I)-responsive transcriptional regulator [Inquilinus sp.]|nr:Cu(I)-responsive transcriptional regulator [Inquilinus sp.]